MVKLYPPIISGTLPAFYLENSNLDRIIKITVPFTMNRAVSPAQVKGFALKIKTVQNSEYLYTVCTYDKVSFNLEGSSYVNFILKTSNNSSERELILKSLKVGLFYKIQIAYIDQSGEIGNFSTVGISKYTTKPEVKIKNLNINTSNNHLYNYVGIYDQGNGDTTEKVYNYCFTIYDNNNNIIATSGDKIHNTTLDTELNSSYDEFNYMKDFEQYKPYRIQYSVITNNNLQISSPLYTISQKVTIEPDLKADIVAKACFEEGYISIDLVGHKNEIGTESVSSGSFILSRANESDGYTHWEQLSTFKLISEIPSRHLWKDFTAEQGCNYRYSIQQYNDDGMFSLRLLSNIVFSDFEDAFLYDGERQLKIRYNPKLGNLKINLAENKVETLGSKYPYFFKNSEINYKEFTIAGLLSYLGDNNFFFISKDELLLEEEKYRRQTKSKDNIVDQISQNIMRERLFKTKVLEWLNNGQPKLFRSPHEGNFIVRLMKVSLAPENKLGRLLHNFNCTAYEIDDFNYDNLIKYNFTHIVSNQDIKLPSWKTIEFISRDENGHIVYPVNTVLNNYPTHNIKILGMRAGQKISLTFEDNTIETIVIGVTGSYSLNSDLAIREIKLLESNLTYTNGVADPYLTGSLTYSFTETTANHFDKIINVENTSYPTRQFIGAHEDILREISCIYYNNEWIVDPKYELLKIFKVKCYARNIEQVTKRDNNYYQGDTSYNMEYANRASLMLVGETVRVSPYYNPVRADYNFIPSYYYDIYNQVDISLQDYDPTININGNIINMKDNKEIEFELDEITSLSCGNGAIVEVSYVMRKTDFKIENNPSYPELYEAKIAYDTINNKLKRYYEILSILGQCNGSWKETESYLNALEKQLDEDMNKETALYYNKLDTLTDNYNNLEDQRLETHNNMVTYLSEKIAALEANPLNTKVYENELAQYKQALYVENYEYDRLTALKYEEFIRQQDILNAEIAKIESKIMLEKQDIRDQATAQLAVVNQAKAEVLEEVKTIYGIEDLENNLDEWHHIRNTLVNELNTAYAIFIDKLIAAQNLEELQEE